MGHPQTPSYLNEASWGVGPFSGCWGHLSVCLSIRGKLGKLLPSCSSSVTAQGSVVVSPCSPSKVTHHLSTRHTSPGPHLPGRAPAWAGQQPQKGPLCLGFSLFVRRNLCSSSRGGSPGLAYAELETTSTGSMGTRLTQTRELRLHFLGGS